MRCVANRRIPKVARRKFGGNLRKTMASTISTVRKIDWSFREGKLVGRVVLRVRDESGLWLVSRSNDRRIFRTASYKTVSVNKGSVTRLPQWLVSRKKKNEKIVTGYPMTGVFVTQRRVTFPDTRTRGYFLRHQGIVYCFATLSPVASLLGPWYATITG